VCYDGRRVTLLRDRAAISQKPCYTVVSWQ
jgi:hypothetical protein